MQAWVTFQRFVLTEFMDCWNIGLLESWFSKRWHQFYDAKLKVRFILNQFLRILNSIIPLFSPSRRALRAGGHQSLRGAEFCKPEATIPLRAYALPAGDQLGQSARIVSSNPR